MNIISHDSETAAHGKQVITACALIHHNFDGIIKVFLPKRAETKKFLPGKFELPGGHIEYGEDMIEGLKREMMEEFEMLINVGDPFAVFTYINEIKGSHSIEVIYFATFAGPIENIKINPEDHSEFIWVSLEDIKNMDLKDDIEMQYIEKGLSLLNGGKISFGN
jgi:8-oxo-dGTP diphosphatase